MKYYRFNKVSNKIWELIEKDGKKKEKVIKSDVHAIVFATFKRILLKQELSLKETLDDSPTKS